MKQYLLVAAVAVLLLAGCQPQERINIERNVHQQPAPNIQATVLPEPAPVAKVVDESAAKPAEGQDRHAD